MSNPNYPEGVTERDIDRLGQLMNEEETKMIEQLCISCEYNFDGRHKNICAICLEKENKILKSELPKICDLLEKIRDTAQHRTDCKGICHNYCPILMSSAAFSIAKSILDSTEKEEVKP